MTKNKKSGPFQFMQFSVIGASNALIDIGVLNLLLILFNNENWGLLLLYNTIAYILSIVNSYFWNAKFTFRHAAEGSNRQRMMFMIQALVSLGVNNVGFIGVNALMAAIGVPNWIRYNLAKGVAMFLSFIASFFMIKYAVFRKKPTH